MRNIGFDKLARFAMNQNLISIHLGLVGEISTLIGIYGSRLNSESERRDNEAYLHEVESVIVNLEPLQ